MKKYITSSDEDEREQFQQRKNYRGKTGRRQGNYLKVNKPVIYLLLAIAFILFLMLAVDLKLKFEARMGQHYRTTHPKKHQEGEINCRGRVFCENVLEVATKGFWSNQQNSKPLPWKQHDIKKVREVMKLPTNMSRDDFRCGLEFPIANTRLGAHCDANSTPYHCCNEDTGWCGETAEHCNDSLSFDMNLVIPQANAKWMISSDSQCDIRTFSSQEACGILSKTVKKLIFLGDSQARRFFTALVLFLTNNYLNGAIKEEYKTNKDIVASCEGDYQILNNDCRKYIITSSKDVKQLCDEEIDFELEYFADFRTYVNSETTAKYESTYDQDRTYIIVGAGTHFNSDHSTFLQYYFKYMVEGKGTRVWPRYIVETLHEVYSRVSTKKRQEFNKVVQEYVAEQANLDVFDNFMLSSMLESYDGRTHGLKFHMLKVDILMHYFYNKDSCQK